MWQTLSTNVIHKNNWYKIVKKDFLTEKNAPGQYFIVETFGSAMVIPVIEDKIVFTKQYRFPIDRLSIELPAGGVKEGRTYLETAKDELEEELGYAAGELKKIGEFAPFNGISSEICEVYLARDLEFVGAKLEETENISALTIKIDDVWSMIERGEIIDGMTLSSLSLARHVLKT